MPCTVTPGADVLALRCTTQPTTRRRGQARRRSRRPGRRCVSRVPSTGPPSPSQNHHGTPFMAGSTTVCGPISGASRGASSASDWRLHGQDDDVGLAEVGRVVAGHAPARRSGRRPRAAASRCPATPPASRRGPARTSSCRPPPAGRRSCRRPPRHRRRRPRPGLSSIRSPGEAISHGCTTRRLMHLRERVVH